MAAFREEEIQWHRLDVQAIVGQSGLATVKESHRAASLMWLRNQGYRVDPVDCQGGVASVSSQFGEMFRWEENFGYRLEGRANLDALRDGFEVDVPAEMTGVALELYRPDELWREDFRWFRNVLSIAIEHSRHQLACGKRFFTLLVLPDGADLIGMTADEIVVPYFSSLPR